MYWYLLCTSTDFDRSKIPEKYATDLAKVAKVRGYKHAFLAFSLSNKGLSGKVTLAEFSEQEIKYYLNQQLVQIKGDYYEWGLDVALVADHGESDKITNSKISAAGEAWWRDALATSKNKNPGYPVDCLGYCVRVLKEIGQTTVMDLSKNEKSKDE